MVRLLAALSGRGSVAPFEAKRCKNRGWHTSIGRMLFVGK